MRLPLPPEYLEFLAPYPAATQELALAAREALIAQLPDCVEVLWDATNTVGMGYGFTELTRDHFIHLPAYTKYVNIGFSHGASLNDPEGRLQGTGARIRHIRITHAADLQDPYLQDLIQQAVAGANRPTKAEPARTVIRVMSGPKRRPS